VKGTPSVVADAAHDEVIADEQGVSIEPEGITRAWPIVPLMRRNARPTQNHAMISR